MLLFNTGFSKLIVIGGYNGELVSALSSVEAIDLENPYTTCNLISDYPIEDSGMAVGIIDGRIKSCGSSYDRNDCYDYNPETNTWSTSESLMRKRDTPRSSFIDGVWLVSGDEFYYDEGDSPLSTEMWTSDGFEKGPYLPTKMYSHCQLPINSSHVFFAETYNTGKSYLLDWYSQEWIELPPVTADYNYCT